MLLFPYLFVLFFPPFLSLSLSPHRYTNISQYFTRLITTTNALCNSIKIQQLKRIKSFLKDFEIAKIFSTRCTIVHALKCIPNLSPLLLVSLASSTIETFSRIVESSSLDETRTARKVKRAALFYIRATSLQIARVKAHIANDVRETERERRETRSHLMRGDIKDTEEEEEGKEDGKGEERRWLKDRLDDFLRRHPRNTRIGEHENSCNQFSPALAHEPHRVMQYNMWKRASPSNPMSSHPIL